MSAGGMDAVALFEGNERPEFIVKLTARTHWMDFVVYEAMGWIDGNTPYEPKEYVRGRIKWDGCSHVYFGYDAEEDTTGGYLHLCGKDSWDAHCAVMTRLYELAATNIPKYDASVAEL